MEQLGEYLIRRLIGEGGMGKVYEAEERLSKRRVALKVLHPELGKSDMGRKLFLNEMQILAHLEHPNIVRSLASMEIDGQLVMVLEYLEGQTLRSYLNDKRRLSWQEAVRIASAVASALVAAHEQQPPIIHRDLKPENIMVIDTGTIKVMDFGIAKVIEAMNQTNTQSVGTLQYMSPEQIDARTIDHRSDLYCLGLVLYEMLAGRPPFQSASPRQLLNMQCTAEPPPFEDDVRVGLPKGVDDLVFQLLEKAPEDRPFFAQDIVDTLEPFQTAGSTSTRSRPGSRTSSTTSSHESSSKKARTDADAAERASGRSHKPADTTARDDAEEEEEEEEEEESSSKPERKDTIALVEAVDKPREVPTKLALGIIVFASLIAGIVAYYVRASADPKTVLEGAPTSTVLPLSTKTGSSKKGPR